MWFYIFNKLKTIDEIDVEYIINNGLLYSLGDKGYHNYEKQKHD